MRKINVCLVFLILLLCGNNIFARDIFVSVEGNANNKGTIESPLDFSSAINQLNSLGEQGELAQGITINLREGRYAFSESYSINAAVQGSVDYPIVIKAYQDEKVIFDGGRSIAAKGFRSVTNKKEVSRLAKSAVGKVKVKTIKDKELIAKLKSEIIMLLSIDDGIFLPSCYPNDGYAELKKELAIEEITAPACPLNEHARAGFPPYQEEGKPVGWKGTLAEPRGAHAGIAKRENEMAGTWSQWEAELERDNTRNLLYGFVDAHWLLRSFPLVGVDEMAETMHFSSALAYGWGEISDKIFKVFGLLCELDSPGEWHFDAKTNRLYIYPPNELKDDTPIGLPFADGFLTLDDASYVRIENISVVNVGEGAAFKLGGNHNLIAGCQVNNSTATGAVISGKHNGVKACDFIDLNKHVVITGGTRAPNEITPAYNYAQNCHFYQKYFKHEKVNIVMNGVGNIFRNNLVHNSIGQAMIVYGNDQLVELNEFFNIGYDEGDGGAVYSGADLAGYGNVYRYNFFHHLMNVPGKTDRAGIHLDDLQAGGTCTGNVFYKSASKGVFMNAGAGHTITDNVCLEGFLGIYNVGVGASKFYNLQEEILKDPNHDHVNTKEDYVGNAEKIVGPEGWNNPVWKTKYPRFAMVMNDIGEHGRMWPIRCVVDNNLFYGNSAGDSTIWSRFSPESRAKSEIRNDAVVSPVEFENYEEMNFKFKESVKGYPQTHFEDMGLYTDEYRKVMPDKKVYRMAIKNFYDGIPSQPGTTKIFNSAVAVEKSINN